MDNPGVANNDLHNELKKALEEADKYVSTDRMLTCILHHVHDNDLGDLKAKVEECRQNKISTDLFNENVQTLAALGLIYIYMNNMCSITKLGERLIADLDRRGIYSHPLKSVA